MLTEGCNHKPVSLLFLIGRNIAKEYCQSKLERGMFWNWTSIGITARQPCPGGASGLAKWKCVENLHNNHLPMWFPDSPDLSDCKSAWLGSLQVCFTFFLSNI